MIVWEKRTESFGDKGTQSWVLREIKDISGRGQLTKDVEVRISCLEQDIGVCPTDLE